MTYILLTFVFLDILVLVKGSCYYFYYQCDGYDWCCPDGYICTGTSTCLSIGAIVGICIGCIIGLVFFVGLICLCVSASKKSTGRVVHPGGTTVVSTTGTYGQQQYGQQQYGQQQPYGQQMYGGAPMGGTSQMDPAYPPPPPPYK